MVTIPTISDLYTAIKADLTAKYGSPIDPFGKNFLRALCMEQAGQLHLFYLALGNVQKNIFVDTADSEQQGGTLQRFGRVKLGRDPYPATAGKYLVSVSGTSGAVINAGQTFKSNDDSTSPAKLFVLDAGYSLPGTTGFITLRALDPGLDSKLNIGDGLTATSPIANVKSAVFVTTETVQPLAAEDLEAYRQLAINAYRDEPQGGAATDYRLWSADAQGVAQTYPYAKTAATNEVNLYVEATLADSSDGKGTPTAFILNAVQAVVEFDPDTTKPLNQRGRRPVNVIVHYLPVTIRNVDIVISGFVNLTAAQQTAIFSAMKEELTTVRPFVGAADVLTDKNDIFSNNTIVATIFDAVPGATFGAIQLKIDGTIYTSFTFLNGDIPFLSSITYN